MRNFRYQFKMVKENKETVDKQFARSYSGGEVLDE